MSIGSVFAYSAQPFIDARVPPMPRIKGVVFVISGPRGCQHLEAAIDFCGWPVKTFWSAEEFLACPRFLGPSCLVLDITLPGLSEIGIQKNLAADRPHMPIVLTTGSGDVLMTVQAMESGYGNLAMTDGEDERLPDAVRHAVEYSERALNHKRQIDVLRGRYESCSDRQRQVMALVVAGLLNKQIGCELGISEITVKAHRGNVMRKMEARSLAEMVKMAASLG